MIFVSAFSSIAKSSSTIQIYQKSQTSPQQLDDSNGSRSAKNSSATPTPTLSGQDVVRIYVPPADDMIPDKNVVRRERGDDEISQSSNRSSIIHVEYETLPFERSSSHVDSNPLNKSPSKNDQTSPGANKFQPQQYYYYPNPNPNQTLYQSSSSRRGSMTRKTPSPLLNELIVECDHMKIRRSHENVNEDFSINGSTTNSNKFYQFNANTYNSNNNNSLKRLTSFEELAKKSENNSLLYIHSTSPDINFRQSQSTSKPKSDYNICYNYKNLDNREELNYTNIKQQSMIKKSASHSHNIRRGDRKHSSSENSPFDYDLLKEKRKENRFMYDDDATDGKPLEINENSIKSYDRFFNSDDELEDDEIRHNRASKKSSSSGTHKYRSHISGTEADDDDENSSNSPTNKSILNTPIFETMPLLSTDSDATAYQSQPLPAMPLSSNSLRHKSKIPRPRGSSNNNSLRKNSSVSSPESEGYQTSVNRYEKPASGMNQTGSNSKGSDNKIRIKINQQ